MTLVAQLVAAMCTLRRNCRGIAAAEFALIAPVMLTMMFGLYDIGNAIQIRLQLEQAVRAGGQFALSWPDQAGGISAAIKAALPPTWNASVSASAPACWCWDSGGSTATPCSTTCPSGSTKRSYVTLTATNNASPFLFSAVAGNSATYVVRFQ